MKFRIGDQARCTHPNLDWKGQVVTIKTVPAHRTGWYLVERSDGEEGSLYENEMQLVEDSVVATVSGDTELQEAVLRWKELLQ